MPDFSHPAKLLERAHLMTAGCDASLEDGCELCRLVLDLAKEVEHAKRARAALRALHAAIWNEASDWPFPATHPAMKEARAVLAEGDEHV